MKVLIPLLTLILLPMPACQAQLSVQSDKGNVTIGTDGAINVQGAQGQNGGNVKITPTGIDVHNGGDNVKIRSNGITGTTTTTGSPHRATTVRSGQSAPVKSGGSTARGGGASANVTIGAGMADQVATIELAVYGHKNESLPLIARVEKLETENLGKKGTGTLKERIDILAKSLGVTLTTSAQAATGQSAGAVSAKPETRVAGGGPDIQIFDNNGNETLDCEGRSVVVQGNNNNITLKGHCKTLLLNGNSNFVRAESVDEIVANGNYNKAVWPRTSNPSISSLGTGNSLTPQ